MEQLSATAIYHDGKNNVQVNFKGSKLKVISSFNAEMKQRNVEWAHLFEEKSGDKICSYPASEQEADKEVKQVVIEIGSEELTSLPSVQLIVFSDPIEALKMSRSLLEQSTFALEKGNGENCRIRIPTFGKCFLSD